MQVMDNLPLDLLSRTLSFLDGESLLTCACVCKDFCQLTDHRSYWENAAWRLFPHLKETYDIMPYNGDWKALFQDRNRRNRSAVFEWTVTDFLSNPERRYSPSFRVEDYTFKVIVDPVGNPNVYFLEPGVSVYLACSPAAPLPPSTAATAALAASVAAGLPIPPVAEALVQNPGFSEAVAAATAAAATGMPTGLNPNHHMEAAAMAALSGYGHGGGIGSPPGDWECCCAFSLTACNQQRKGRNVTWHSSMLNDRFHKNRKNWGVHSLLPVTKLKDPASGFVVDDALKLKVRLRLLYLTVKVVRNAHLAAHEGFGIMDTGAEAPAGADDSLTYELFHCTTLTAFKEMLARDLGMPSPEHFRLWVFTQPWPDTILCPREILTNAGGSSNSSSSNGQPTPTTAPPVAQNQNPHQLNPNAAVTPPQHTPLAPLAPVPPTVPAPPAAPLADEDASAVTLFSLLQLHMDGLGVARVWAECAEDGGFASTPAWTSGTAAVEEMDEEERDAPELSVLMATSQDEGQGSQPDKGENSRGEADGCLPDIPGLHQCQAHQTLSPVALMPDSRDLCHQSHAAQSAAAATEDPAALAVVPPCPMPSPNMHVLVFLKWMNPVSGRIAYLSHAVVTHRTLLRHMFVLVGGLVHRPPETLGAHMETTPATWQRCGQGMHRMIACPLPAQHLRGVARPRDNNRERPEEQATLRDIGVENGQILTFYVEGMEAVVEGTYRGYLEELFHEACVMYYGQDSLQAAERARSLMCMDVEDEMVEEDCSQQYVGKSSSAGDQKNERMGKTGPSRGNTKKGVTAAGATTEDREGTAGALACFLAPPALANAALFSSRPRVRPRRASPKYSTLKLEQVVNLFERFGYQSFRVRNVYYQHKHMNARQTMDYVIQGRHLGFCCDRCGATDFTGPRYKCCMVRVEASFLARGRDGKRLVAPLKPSPAHSMPFSCALPYIL